MPESAPLASEDLSDLIELALMTHDKIWFDELSAKLAAASSLTSKSVGKVQPSRAIQSRLLQIDRRNPMDVEDIGFQGNNN
ncbi:hypothetical protein FU659_34190 [Paenibacillus sp. N3.4]|nr:hypothetical protein FU659_34190 [Paenibacillus sp. N3.4]